MSKIYSALASIMRETNAITKSRRNTTQNFMFRGIDDVMNELHQSFSNHNVFILPEVLNFTVDEKVTGKGTLLYYTRATIKYHFVAEDGSEVTTTNVGEAMDSGDKGMNKAMSVALKYALLQMLLIPTEEEKDPDATTPPPTKPKTIQDVINGLDKMKDNELINALTETTNAKNIEELQAVWNKYPALQSNRTFTQCVTTQKKHVS